MNYVQTLEYDKRKEIINRIQNEEKFSKIKERITEYIDLNQKSFIDCYFLIIKNLCELRGNFIKKEEYEKIMNLFRIKYFVDNGSVNTPILYGTLELIFSGLINNLYLHFFQMKRSKIYPTKILVLDISNIQN